MCGRGKMVKTLQEKVKDASKILKSNGFVDIIDDKTINNSGNIYISNSQKDNLKGCPVIVIVLKNKVEIKINNTDKRMDGK